MISVYLKRPSNKAKAKTKSQMANATAVKRGPGRPPKTEIGEFVKRGPGRPKKIESLHDTPPKEETPKSTRKAFNLAFKLAKESIHDNHPVWHKMAGELLAAFLNKNQD